MIQRNQLDDTQAGTRDGGDGNKAESNNQELRICRIEYGQSVLNDFRRIGRQRLCRADIASQTDDRAKPSRLGLYGKEESDQAKYKCEASTF